MHDSSMSDGLSNGGSIIRKKKKIVLTDSIISMNVVDTFINKHGKKMRIVRIKKKKKRNTETE